MMCRVTIFLLVGVVTGSFQQVDADECAGNGVGCTDCATVTYEPSLNAIVVTDPDWAFDCCGVITRWELSIGYTGYIDLQVWEPYDVFQYQCRMIAFTTVSVDTTSGYDITIEVTDPAKQLPVQPGYVIGWLAYGMDNIWFHDYCEYYGRTGCTYDYMMHNFTELLAIPSTYAPGQVHNFTQDGFYRNHNIQYGIKAFASPGAAPQLDNLPFTININYDDAIPFNIFVVMSSDANTLETLSLNMTSVVPDTDIFHFDDSTGDVSIVAPVPIMPCNPMYNLTFEVSDGCNTTSSYLYVVVSCPVTSTTDDDTTTVEVTTTQETTTIEDTTTADVTTTAELTTIDESTTDDVTTTVEVTTTQETSTKEDTTTADVTTTAELTTIEESTTDDVTTTTEVTTTQETTTMKDTTTNYETATDDVTTTAEPTTTDEITSDVTTTVDVTTTEELTKMESTTTDVTTTVDTTSSVVTGVTTDDSTTATDVTTSTESDTSSTTTPTATTTTTTTTTTTVKPTTSTTATTTTTTRSRIIRRTRKYGTYKPSPTTRTTTTARLVTTEEGITPLDEKSEDNDLFNTTQDKLTFGLAVGCGALLLASIGVIAALGRNTCKLRQAAGLGRRNAKGNKVLNNQLNEEKPSKETNQAKSKHGNNSRPSSGKKTNNRVNPANWDEADFVPPHTPIQSPRTLTPRDVMPTMPPSDTIISKPPVKAVYGV